MCIRDSTCTALQLANFFQDVSVDLDKGRIYLPAEVLDNFCLLYTSDAADERSSVDLGGRRIIKKKTRVEITQRHNI